MDLVKDFNSQITIKLANTVISMNKPIGKDINQVKRELKGGNE